LLTTLIGTAQGLVFALVGVEIAALASALPIEPLRPFLVAGAAVAVALATLGLLASFFHLGHPERAWRAAARWRTSWLSREVIALPLFIALAAGYGLDHYAAGRSTVIVGIAAATAGMALFVCTGMVYAAVRVIREWASPLTVANYTLLGSASGTTLAAAAAAYVAPDHAISLARLALLLTIAGAAGRIAALDRNARLARQPKSTPQSAIGIRHPRIVQTSQGAMGGSFGNREFHHGASDSALKAVQWTMMAGAFAIPAALLAIALASTGGIATPLAAAFAIQYAGLLAERWFFFAQARHPQNIYHGNRA